SGLPRLVRTEWRLFWLAMLLFWAPFGAMVASSYVDQRWVESILSPETMRMLQIGFGHDSEVSDLRDSFGSNFAMFGFYIRNNVGIDLRIFAGGMLFGLGTIFFVVFNGLAIGASTGYLIQAGDPMKFLNWTSGHATPELIGMIFAAMAGFKIGFAMIKPGRYSRKDALVRAGRVAIRLLFGAVFMTTFAAFIEGFWSPVAFPENVKYTFGVVIVTVTAAYLLLAGRGAPRGA
ncbi:MAG: stage II sporulation protein M, partial [Verrucomicrobiota bacterium]